MEIQGFANISGVGVYLPAQVVRSDDLMNEAHSHNFGVPHEFLQRFSGIEERRYANDDEHPSTMAISASRVAIENSGIDPKEIDQVFFCGIDREYSEPATAHLVTKELGIQNGTASCDISDACHGIMSGFQLANSLIGVGAAENILLCTGEKPSLVGIDVLRQLKSCTDRNEFKRLMGALTLGDSGAAIVVSKSKNSAEGCQSMQVLGKSDCAGLCYYRRSDEGYDFSMQMSDISNEAIQLHRNLIRATYEKVGWTPEQVRYVYCHQAGLKPHIKMAELTEQPLNKVPITFRKYGNLTSSTIIVNIYENPPLRGDKIMILGVGSGLSISQTTLIV